MVAVRMVRVRNMSVSEAADIQGRCPNCVRNRLRRYDKRDLEGLRDLPRCGRPRMISRNVMDAIVANVTGCRITSPDCDQGFVGSSGSVPPLASRALRSASSRRSRVSRITRYTRRAGSLTQIERRSEANAASG